MSSSIWNDELLVWPKDDHIEMHTNLYTNLTNSCILHIYYMWQDIRMLRILLKFARKSQIYALDKMWYKDIHTRVTGIFLKEQTRDSIPKSTMFVHVNHFGFNDVYMSWRNHYKGIITYSTFSHDLVSLARAILHVCGHIGSSTNQKQFV